MIDVFYIATGPYKAYFNDFIGTIGNFFPGEHKRIHVFSDGLGEHNWQHSEDNEYAIEVIHIMDFPYPIIPLMKTFIISSHMSSYRDMKYVFYFDADTRFMKMPNKFWTDMKSIMDGGECIISQHPGDMNGPEYEIDRDSESYIGHSTYFYVISSFFAGSPDTMLRLSRKVQEMEEKDLQHHVGGHSEHYIPPLFDQDYINKVVSDGTDISFRIKRYVHIPWMDREPSNDWFVEQKYNIQLKFKKKNME